MAEQKNTSPAKKKFQPSNIFKKRLRGIVVSAKMQKTVVVAVSTLKKHPKYQKRYRFTQKYKAHDQQEQCQAGDRVEIIECRPLSRDKKWRVIYPKSPVSKSSADSKKEVAPDKEGWSKP